MGSAGTQTQGLNVVSLFPAVLVEWGIVVIMNNLKRRRKMVVISIVWYVTDKGEYIRLYMVNKNEQNKNKTSTKNDDEE